MHGWLFKDIYAVKLETLAILANDPQNLNNAINPCLIDINIILYHVMFFHEIYINIPIMANSTSIIKYSINRLRVLSINSIKRKPYRHPFNHLFYVFML